MSVSSLIGNCVGTMRYGCTVEVWCESLDGGPTDSRIVTVPFPTEEIAKAVGDAAAFRG